jgi:hypothetical protein
LQGAGAIARNYGDKGAIVITFSEDGLTRVGENLTPEELREVLCTAIHYSFVFADEAVKEPDETAWSLSLFRAYAELGSARLFTHTAESAGLNAYAADNST